MAAIAQRDQEKRTIEVNREKLIQILESNKRKHIKDYEEAKEGYKAVLLSKVNEAFEEAKIKLQKKFDFTKEKIRGLSESDIEKQSDRFVLLDSIHFEMKVPRLYSKEYDAAIDMAKWDVRETLVLTYAEFTCFVRDEWDWTSDFQAVTMCYK